MQKKDIDWGNLGFGYMKTDKRFTRVIFPLFQPQGTILFLQGALKVVNS